MFSFRLGLKFIDDRLERVAGLKGSGPDSNDAGMSQLCENRPAKNHWVKNHWVKNHSSINHTRINRKATSWTQRWVSASS
jgi:hypothetical protein